MALAWFAPSRGERLAAKWPGAVGRKCRSPRFEKTRVKGDFFLPCAFWWEGAFRSRDDWVYFRLQRMNRAATLECRTDFTSWTNLFILSRLMLFNFLSRYFTRIILYLKFLIILSKPRCGWACKFYGHGKLASKFLGILEKKKRKCRFRTEEVESRLS